MKLIPQSSYEERGPMWVPSFVGDVALVIGNGESRSWYSPCHQTIMRDGVDTWGCNAIYRDMWVDNLVAVDFPMQQEIYTADLLEGQFTTGDTMRFHFTNWSPVPAEIADMMFMGYL